MKKEMYYKNQPCTVIAELEKELQELNEHLSEV